MYKSRNLSILLPLLMLMYFFSPSSAHVNVFFFVVSFGLANEYEPMSHVLAMFLGLPL